MQSYDDLIATQIMNDTIFKDEYEQLETTRHMMIRNMTNSDKTTQTFL